MHLFKTETVSVFACLVLLVGVGPYANAANGCTGGGLDTKVHGLFFSNQPLVATLFELGSRSRTCFGLRALDALAFTRNLRVSQQDASVRQIILSMLRQLPGYEMQESPPTIVLVGRMHSIPQGSLFETTVPEFRSPRASLQTISNALKMQLFLQRDPRIHGFAGTYSPGDRNDLVGPIDERGRNISELLNVIVGESAGAMWLPSSPEFRSARSKDFSPWIIIEYGTPDSEATIQIRELLPHFQKDE